jgi:hypothetical protein
MEKLDIANKIEYIFNRAFSSVQELKRWQEDQSPSLDELIKKIRQIAPTLIEQVSYKEVEDGVKHLFYEHQIKSNAEKILKQIGEQMEDYKKCMVLKNGKRSNYQIAFAQVFFDELNQSLKNISEIQKYLNLYQCREFNQKITNTIKQLRILIIQNPNFKEPNKDKRTEENNQLAKVHFKIISIGRMLESYHQKFLDTTYNLENMNKCDCMFEKRNDAEVIFKDLRIYKEDLTKLSVALKSDNIKMFDEEIAQIEEKLNDFLMEVGSLRRSDLEEVFEDFAPEFDELFDKSYETIKNEKGSSLEDFFRYLIAQSKEQLGAKLLEKNIDEEMLSDYISELLQSKRKYEMTDLVKKHPNFIKIVALYQSCSTEDRVKNKLSFCVKNYIKGEFISPLTINEFKAEILMAQQDFVSKDLSFLFKEFEIPFIFSADEKIWESLEEIYKQINSKVGKKTKAKAKIKKEKGEIKTTKDLVLVMNKKLKQECKQMIIDGEISEEELEQHVLIILKKIRCREVNTIFVKHNVTYPEIESMDMQELIAEYISIYPSSSLNINKFEKRFIEQYTPKGGGGSK